MQRICQDNGTRLFREKKDRPISIGDRKFLDITSNGIHVTEDGHYEILLPFRNKNVELPYNRKMAKARLNTL